VSDAPSLHLASGDMDPAYAQPRSRRGPLVATPHDGAVRAYPLPQVLRCFGLAQR